MSYRPLIMTTHQHLSRHKPGLPQPTRQESWQGKGIALLRCSFGVLWGFVAWQTCQPSFRSHLISTLPQTLNAWSSFWLHLMSSQPLFTSYFLAACEFSLALCLLAGAFNKQMNIGGSVFTLFLWSTLGGCGLLKDPVSTTTGSMLLFLMVFLGLFLSHAGSYYGFDRYFASRAERRSHLNPDAFKIQKQPGRSAHQPELSDRGPQQTTTGQHPAIQRASRPWPARNTEPARPRTYKDPRYAPM
ncbi:MAG TPA: hypothetical protein VL485_03325 [Ktedonobacteraceae bacterium]|nr:hypothetical protein [Ktedonobacteraceae bacterium]